jgi:osmoprotectant transport system ATP-binding protein
MLTLSDISKRYDSLQALHPTTLAFPPGQTSVLIGPSGCGKSTLLRILIGLVLPDSGAVTFDETTLTTANALALRLRMGYVIQDGGLFPHLTAGENAGIMARHLKWDDERIHTRIAELADLTQFPIDGLDRFPAQLSGGQKQRVSLMRALMLDPEVLLLDEPLGALDPMIRADLQQQLRAIFRKLGKTVVMVTHDIHEAAYFGDAIVMMRDGQIIQRGTFAELDNNPADPFVTQFINAQNITAENEGEQP